MASYGDSSRAVRYSAPALCKGPDKTKQIPEDQMVLEEPRVTGLYYDQCSYDKYVQESTGPGKWWLSQKMDYDMSKHNDHSGFMNTTNRGIPSKNVDVDSNLRTLGVYNSSCPENKLNPFLGETCKECESYSPGMMCDKCKDRLIDDTGPVQLQHMYVDTRDKRQCNNVADIHINRFESLCVDPQKLSRIQSNNFIGLDSRGTIKNIIRKNRLANEQSKSKQILMEIKRKYVCDCPLSKKNSSLGCMHTKDVNKNYILPL
jgi:hypothetical protein